MNPLNLMNQTITYMPRTGSDIYNVPTYGAGVVLRARVQDTIERLQLDTTEELIAVTVIYCENNGITVPQTTGKITLTDGTSPPILAVTATRDRLGNIAFFKIHIGLSFIRNT